MTFQDVYNQDLDDEEDDSDWEPLQRSAELVKWFCTNCTMVNLGDDVNCDVSYFPLGCFTILPLICFICILSGIHGCARIIWCYCSHADMWGT